MASGCLEKGACCNAALSSRKRPYASPASLPKLLAILTRLVAAAVGDLQRLSFLMRFLSGLVSLLTPVSLRLGPIST